MRILFEVGAYLKTSSLVLDNGTIVGINGDLFNGLSFVSIMWVAWASDNTKNECQCVYDENKNRKKIRVYHFTYIQVVSSATLNIFSSTDSNTNKMTYANL